jgi:uncharacterized protein YgfB (UPF0149 family)
VKSHVDHDLLNDALQRCGASWTAAQAHGLLSSRLAVTGVRGVTESLAKVLDNSSETDAPAKECQDMLVTLWQSTHMVFSERLSAFEPLLPDENDKPSTRTEALAHWCEGYLHGLVSGEHDAALKKRLAAEPLADIIKDMLQITRAVVDGDDDDESNEKSYVEIVEYLRVAAQLVYEELAELRPGQLQ